ncbi:hypothetical protein GE09DRAFT_621966 [Coniochaeta sp. 2T2.1]|nr:hypothetical protein GE09DRAFT_621966 [Coniochaeta sp. 2T2.1]
MDCCGALDFNANCCPPAPDYFDRFELPPGFMDRHRARIDGFAEMLRVFPEADMGLDLYNPFGFPAPAAAAVPNAAVPAAPAARGAHHANAALAPAAVDVNGGFANFMNAVANHPRRHEFDEAVMRRVRDRLPAGAPPLQVAAMRNQAALDLVGEARQRRQQESQGAQRPQPAQRQQVEQQQPGQQQGGRQQAGRQQVARQPPKPQGPAQSRGSNAVKVEADLKDNDREERLRRRNEARDAEARRVLEQRVAHNARQQEARNAQQAAQNRRRVAQVAQQQAAANQQRAPQNQQQAPQNQQPAAPNQLQASQRRASAQMAAIQQRHAQLALLNRQAPANGQNAAQAAQAAGPRAAPSLAELEARRQQMGAAWLRGGNALAVALNNPLANVVNGLLPNVAGAINNGPRVIRVAHPVRHINPVLLGMGGPHVHVNRLAPGGGGRLGGQAGL